jgi:hypothetical protein
MSRTYHKEKIVAFGKDGYRKSIYCRRNIISIDGKSIGQKDCCSLREELNRIAK